MFLLLLLSFDFDCGVRVCGVAGHGDLCSVVSQTRKNTVKRQQMCHT